MSVSNNTSRTIDGENVLFCDSIEITEEIILNGDNGSANEIIYSDGVKARWSSITTLLTAGTGINIAGSTISTANVPNSALANSTISGKGLGTNLDDLTAGSNIVFASLDGLETTYNGSKGITIVADVPVYTAGTGLTLTGTEFSTNNIPNSDLANSSISGKALGTNLDNLTAGTNITYSAGATYNGGSAITINATDTNTEYTAGTGLTLSGTEFSTNNIPNSDLANSTISGKALGTNLDNLTAGTNITFSSGTTYNGGSAITINSTDNDTSYTAGTGLDLSGTEFSTTNSVLNNRGTSDISIGEEVLGMDTQIIRVGRGAKHQIILDTTHTINIAADHITFALDPSGANQLIQFDNLPDETNVPATSNCLYVDVAAGRILKLSP